MTMAEPNRLVKSSGENGSHRFDASSLGRNMDAFDNFLGDIAQEPVASSSSATTTTTTTTRAKHLEAAVNVVDSDDESMFSSDSEDEFGSEKVKPQYHQTDGALEQLFSKGQKTPAPAPRAGEGRPRSVTKKPDLLSKSEHGPSRRRTTKEDSSGHSRRQAGKDELSSASSHGGQRATKDELSSSSHGRRRSTKDDLSSSSHGARRRHTKDQQSATKDELSSSSHGRRRSGKDDLSSSSHGSRRRHTKDELSSSNHGGKRRSGKIEEPSQRRCGKKDDLSRSEHSKPRIRRNDLYSKAHAGKAETTRGSQTMTSMDFELAADSAKKLQERRAHYERARQEKLGRQSASGGTMRRVDNHSSTNDLARRNIKTGLSELSRSDHRSPSMNRESSLRGRRADHLSRSEHGSSSRSASREAGGSRRTRERHGSGDLSQSGSSVDPKRSKERCGSGSLSRAVSSADTKGLAGMYSANRGSGGSGMRRSSSSTDAHSLGRKSRPSSRGSSTDIDGLVMKLKRESKTSTLSKDNASWDLKSSERVDKTDPGGDSDIED